MDRLDAMKVFVVALDEGSLAALRHLGAHVIEVTFDGPPPRLPRLPRWGRA